MDRKQPTSLEPLEDVEVWEPDITHQVQPRIGRAMPGRRTTVSVPGAIAGAFLVCALAFGSSLGAATGQDPTSADGDGPHATTDAAAADVAFLGYAGDGDAAKDDEAHPGADADPEAEAGSEAAEPTDEASEELPAAHEPAAIGLELGLRGNDVKLAWTACTVDGFVAYKIIRSTNMGATYPRGEGDSLIGVVESASRTTFVDEQAPAETKLWYAVFGLARDGDKTYVACASDDRGLITPAKPEPTPTETDKPAETAAPEVPALGLTLAIKEGHVYLDWSTCKAEGAEAYKVVRSKDSTVRWPLGENDTLIAAVGMDGKTAAWDESAPKGKRLWYRVFCVRHAGEGYKVLTSSKTKSIETPAGEPAPEVIALSLEVDSVEGNAVLHWEACEVDGFSHYRIVRKAYEGTTVVKEIEAAGVTTWTDETVEVGETYKYTVQCKGHVGDTWPLLGTSDAVAVTIE
jgi:hypothetical protein